jgi:hypothetical protein
MALAILGVLSVTACGSSVNHLTSPSDSPSSQSSQQTFVAQLEPSPKGTVSSNAAACSILTTSMAKSFLGRAVDKPRGEVLSDGQGSECQYFPQTFSADNVALTIYSKMSMAEFLDHPWEPSGATSFEWSSTGLQLPTEAWSSDLVGQIGVRQGANVWLLDFTASRFEGNTSGLRAAVLGLMKQLLPK